METEDDILKYYKFAYHCSNCSMIYGSDSKETSPYICPICEEKNKK